MKHISTTAVALLIGSAPLFSQTSDLVFFTDDGSKFTLIVDGDVKNEIPAARVVATGIRTESPMLIVRFEDASIPQIRKPFYGPAGKEYTVMITTNKKGERVLRPTGEAALGTARPEPQGKPIPASFEEDRPVATTPATNPGTTIDQSVGVEGVHQTTTVTVVEEDGAGSGGENIQINMGVNGMGINMGVRVDDGTGTSGTTTTTRTTMRTTTTTTTSGGIATAEPTQPVTAPVREPEVNRMPGYTGPVGCGMPMSNTEFGDARKSIEGQSFEDTKMKIARQVGRDRCFTTEQVKGIMGLFSFEDNKLEFAKYAYDRTHDIGNYFKLNDAFSFSSSVDELNTYIESR